MSRFRTWTSSLAEQRHVEFFAADGLVVQIYERGTRKRRVLRRSAALEAAMTEVVTAGVTRNDWCGLLRIMAWGSTDNLRPLYIGKAGRWGKTPAIACERVKGGHFVRGDIRRPLPTHDADVAVCCFDSLNFLPRATDWKEAFHAARSALYLRGQLIFDVVTPWDHRECWPHHHEVVDAPGCLAAT